MSLRTAFWFDSAGRQIHMQGSLAAGVGEAAKRLLTLELGITEPQMAQMRVTRESW